MDLDIQKAIIIERRSKCFDPRDIHTRFIFTSNSVHIVTVIGFQPLYPQGIIIAHVLRPEISVSYPAGTPPRDAIQRNVGVALFRLAHQPPFIAPLEIGVGLGMHVAGLAALG